MLTGEWIVNDPGTNEEIRFKVALSMHLRRLPNSPTVHCNCLILQMARRKMISRP
jgi:hypothetical protein